MCGNKNSKTVLFWSHVTELSVENVKCYHTKKNVVVACTASYNRGKAKYGSESQRDGADGSVAL